MSRGEKLREKKGNYKFALAVGIFSILIFIFTLIIGKWADLFSNTVGARSAAPAFLGVLGLVLVYYSLRGLLKTRNREKLYKENQGPHKNHASD